MRHIGSSSVDLDHKFIIIIFSIEWRWFGPRCALFGGRPRSERACCGCGCDCGYFLKSITEPRCRQLPSTTFQTKSMWMSTHRQRDIANESEFIPLARGWVSDEMCWLLGVRGYAVHFVQNMYAWPICADNSLASAECIPSPSMFWAITFRLLWWVPFPSPCDWFSSPPPLVVGSLLGWVCLSSSSLREFAAQRVGERLPKQHLPNEFKEDMSAKTFFDPSGLGQSRHCCLLTF